MALSSGVCEYLLARHRGALGVSLSCSACPERIALSNQQVSDRGQHRRSPSPNMIPLLSSTTLGAAALSAVSVHVPLPSGYHRFAPRNDNIEWSRCTDPTGEVIRECTRFQVPLDWHNTTGAAGKGSLLKLVARHQAVKKPELGNLFISPGGLGSSAKVCLRLYFRRFTALDFGFQWCRGHPSSTADRRMEASGGQYDIFSNGMTPKYKPELLTHSST